MHKLFCFSFYKKQLHLYYSLNTTSKIFYTRTEVFMVSLAVRDYEVEIIRGFINYTNSSICLKRLFNSFHEGKYGIRLYHLTFPFSSGFMFLLLIQPKYNVPQFVFRGRQWDHFSCILIAYKQNYKRLHRGGPEKVQILSSPHSTTRTFDDLTLLKTNSSQVSSQVSDNV